MGKASFILLTKYREKMSFNFGYICLVSRHQSNQIVIMKKNTCIVLLIFLIGISCQKQTKTGEVVTNDTIIKSDNSQNSLDYFGIYKGKLNIVSNSKKQEIDMEFHLTKTDFKDKFHY